MLSRLRHFVGISRSHRIARRYFVVNGFDGALTMLGLLLGFRFGGMIEIEVAITACVGAAIALGMSGFSSAWLSEAAERRREFRRLQKAMVVDISGTAHHDAARWVPILIGCVNGLSPLLISLLIIAPLFLSLHGGELYGNVMEQAIALAFAVIFLLGVFLGRVSQTFWLYSGLQAVMIALVTAVLIYWVS